MKILKNVFFKTFLVLILFSFAVKAEKRIDLDLRLEPKNVKDFYLLKKILSIKNQLN